MAGQESQGLGATACVIDAKAKQSHDGQVLVFEMALLDVMFCSFPSGAFQILQSFCYAPVEPLGLFITADG